MMQDVDSLYVAQNIITAIMLFLATLSSIPAECLEVILRDRLSCELI
jgi:hypothetical protein